MNLLNFVSQYPDESSCRAKFKEYRDQQGVICPQCGSKEHYWKKDKENYECKHCGKRQSLRANTVMHGSQLPFRYWFIAIHLLTSTKKSFSAMELQRQLGHKRYEPIWNMLHKLRQIMGKRDEQYSLTDVIELDKGFFSTEVEEDEKEHRPQLIPKKEIAKMLPWVHIVISNAKRMLLDIFHDIKPEYLQNYLNEFRYKFNRRYFSENLFDRLLMASVSYKNYFRTNISSFSEFASISSSVERSSSFKRVSLRRSS